MSRRVTPLFAELRSIVQGWWALRAIDFCKYRIPSQRSEPQIEMRLLRGIRGVRRVLSTIRPSHPR